MAASRRSTLAPLNHVLRDPAGAVCSGSRHHSTADRLCIESALVRRVTWRQADAQRLPFAHGMFDAVLCQFEVNVLPDKSRALVEAFRVLKPGGRFLFSVWDRIEANEFADAVVKAVAALFPADPPMFLARTPHGHYDTAASEAQLLTAGFRTTRVETITRESQSLSALSVAVGYCQGTPVRNGIEAHGTAALAAATEAVAAAIAAQYGTGPVTGRIKAHILTATR
jgi:SAM-dependent methyltransferase